VSKEKSNIYSVNEMTGEDLHHILSFLVAEKLTPWQILSLPLRPARCLFFEKIWTIDALCTQTESDLLEIPDMGPKSVDQIKDRLADIGRKLGDRLQLTH